MEIGSSFRAVAAGRWHDRAALSIDEVQKENVETSTPAQKAAMHVEFSTDDLDGLFEELKSNGVEFAQQPHDEPWERAMTAYDPDGYAVEFPLGKRGDNQTAERGFGHLVDGE